MCKFINKSHSCTSQVNSRHKSSKLNQSVLCFTISSYGFDFKCLIVSKKTQRILEMISPSTASSRSRTSAVESSLRCCFHESNWFIALLRHSRFANASMHQPMRAPATCTRCIAQRTKIYRDVAVKQWFWWRCSRFCAEKDSGPMHSPMHGKSTVT